MEMYIAKHMRNIVKINKGEISGLSYLDVKKYVYPFGSSADPLSKRSGASDLRGIV